jgi:PAS fold
LYQLLDLDIADAPVGATAQSILEMQAARGEFRSAGQAGHVARQLEIMTAGIASTYERVRPNGQSLEVSSLPLAGGATMRTYRPITKQIEQRWRYEQQILDLKTRIRELEAAGGAA